MRKVKYIGLVMISWLISFNHFAFSAIPNPDLILQEVKLKFNTVKDYRADVKIKVDVDFVKIPEKSGTIYFLQPDLVRVKTKGFSLLPKRGMNITPQNLLGVNYTAIWIKTDRYEGVEVEVIKVIPIDNEGDIILSTLWVDTDKNIIRKLEATTRDAGTFVISMAFDSPIEGYDLPSKVVVNFDMRKNEIPLGLTGDFENDRPQGAKSKNTRGKVTITYLEYSINNGEGTAYFKKKK